MSKDIFGEAIKDHYNQNSTEDIIVQAPDFDDDIIPTAYLFRSYQEMPSIEQRALDLSKGKTLDIGCGAGSHSLYLQNEKKLDVTAIDVSQGGIEIAKKRGVRQAYVENVYHLQDVKFDTLLLLMNGSGIIGKLNNIDRFLSHIKTLLHPNGQVLIDSSDISYLFTDEDGGFWIDASAGYYGEMQYRLQYKNKQSDWFDWLYIDFNTLQNAANAHGFLCELILEGESYDYLARLTLPT
ncbi:class I SAM-dependent methyltransferase [Aquimarina gracilis]|uniref:Class I SAM-dependent methyltransferase n=1 Tax=Aquimarina gracilis TaxID=874422 RepID=A0ABU5ZYF1_9FLAO|nr:class I SAM-dependent methyltransferase [Aquimarina gracilis]MEB3346835.1 class I SAM-dependent methyltransferase [Aquimarina gracilis]